VSARADGEVLVAADARALAALAAQRLAGAVEQAAERRRKGSDVLLALAGAKTPRACYELLARDPRVPWSRLRVFPGDERAVRPGDPDANVRLLRETLVVPGALAPERLFAPFAERAAQDESGQVDAAERELALARFEALLAAGIDVVLLGLGDDGHTASLFPGSPLLAPPYPPTPRCALVERAPKPPPHRITLTPAAMLAAGRVFMLVSGSEKAEAVAAALEQDGPVADCPARLVRGATWLLDRAAAERLTPARTQT
jgi:6-phosphogluconolactonase